MAKKKAKTKSAKGSKSKPGGPLSRYKSLSDSTKWILFILLVILGVVGYNLTLDALERRKFNEMEKTVDTLVERINGEFGTRTTANTSHCYKASRKLDPEPTLCVFSKTIDTGSIDFLSISSFSLEQSDVLVGGEKAFGNLYFRSLPGNNDCRLEYDNSGFVLEVMCLGYARKNYYPFTD